jgi:hypothetical protein
VLPLLQTLASHGVAWPNGYRANGWNWAAVANQLTCRPSPSNGRNGNNQSAPTKLPTKLPPPVDKQHGRMVPFLLLSQWPHGVDARDKAVHQALFLD